MSVLHRLTDVGKKLQTLWECQLALIAIVGNGQAANQLHDKIRPARNSFAAIEDTRDVRMIHESERLPLGLEASNDLTRVHAGLENLQSDLASNGLHLFGHEHDAKAAF